MIRHSHISSRTTGFTLLEVIMTLVVIGALGAIGATVMSRGFLNYFVGREIARGRRNLQGGQPADHKVAARQEDVPR